MTADILYKEFLLMMSLQNEENNDKPKGKMKTWKKVLLIILAVVIALDVCLVSIFGILYFKGKKAAMPEVSPTIVPPEGIDDIVTDDDGRSVYYLGKEYVYNDNITTCLVMGTDISDYTYGVIGKNGEADALVLMTFDTSSGRVCAINISRDSMTDIKVYSTDGIMTGTQEAQICLAYEYGDGRETSCQNVADAVSGLLCGVPVVRYISLDISAMAVLTDAVDGVEVPEYDERYSNKTGDMITVFGDEARKYVQSRDHSDIASNSVRMQRQTEFLRAFAAKTITKTKSDISTPKRLFDLLGDYMITDVDASLVTYYATNYINKDCKIEFMTVPGTVTVGDNGYAQYHVDKLGVYEMVLSVFYNEKE